MRITKRLVVIVYSVLILAYSCQPTSPEVLSAVAPEEPTYIIRFDQTLDSVYRSNRNQLVDVCAALHPEMATIFFRYVLQLPEGPAGQQLLLDMLDDGSYRQLYEDVQQRFATMNRYELEISQALENFNTLMEEDHRPNVYCILSGFSSQSFLFEDHNGEAIGLGLDMFLGPDFNYYSVDPGNPQFADYLSRAYQPDYFSKKVVEVMIEDRMPPPVKNDFLHLMIWEGKKLYVMDQSLSFQPDTIVAEYSTEQLEWCQNNETEIWNYFFKNNLFYETDLKKFSKLISPSPSVPGMPVEAPGRVGSYMGWQIVKEYMRRHPQASAEALLNLTDAQQILDDSKYKPRRA